MINIKLLIIHLSDIHLKEMERQNHFFNKSDRLIEAIQNYCLEYDQLFLVITGDIAFSGKQSEYLQAMSFIDKIIEEIKKYCGKSFNILMVPGNHDCDHDIKTSKIREAIIDSVLKNGVKAIDESIIEQCCEVQKEWRELQRVYPHNGQEIFKDNLLNIIEFVNGNYNVIFYAYNTSWLSKLNEEPGLLFFPHTYYSKELFKSKADLTISLFHHPFCWQQYHNQRDFKSHIEQTSDIVITGHEHVSKKSRLDDFEGNYTEYIEGAVLQDNEDPSNSGFNILLIDLENKIHKVETYLWNGEIYSCSNRSSDWISYKRYKSLSKNIFQINSNFNIWLDDTEASFSHPFKEKVVLDDIFVYPDLTDLKIEKNDEKSKLDKVISSEILFDINETENKILLIGEDKSGKTTICKYIFKHYLKNGYIPVYLKGDDVRSDDYTKIFKQINKAFCEQYSEDALEHFNQFSNNKKLIIIDDLHFSKLRPEYKINFVKNLTSKYPNIFITGNDLLQIEEIVQYDSTNSSIYDNFKQYKIREFGHLVRSRLIQKWHLIGREKYINEKELLRTHDSSKRIIDAIIGNNFVPSYPFFLLTILQTIEIGNPHDLKESTYGHYYSYLIIQALGKLSLSHDELDAYYNYITELAYFMFKKNIQEITQPNLKSFHSWFCNEYKVTVNLEEITSKLVAAFILEENEGVFKIRYRYVYYFFVAKYLANNINNNSIRETIIKLCKQLYIQGNANIILFLTHHSKDPFILQTLLQNAQAIFKEVEPIKLENDIDQINNLMTDLPKIILNDIDVSKNREKVLHKQDEADLLKEKNEVASTSDLSEGNSEIDYSAKVNFAFKTIEIVGQILKNYYGSLKGENKYHLVEQVYLLALRTLNTVFKLISINKDYLLNDIKQFIDKNKLVDKDKIEEISKRFIFHLAELLAFSLIKKTSGSLGTEKLNEIFNEVKNNYDYISINLIDISIKLDYYKAFPFDDIQFLLERLKSNLFSRSLLTGLVLQYLYMFPTEYKERQKIASILGISIKTQRNIDLISTQKKKT
ncbi:MAG TPA: AAA family ATPase [Thermoanaerobacterales bacterium]|nr:AAA family ATPase [Thermoanaerobacterales bacterium]